MRHKARLALGLAWAAILAVTPAAHAHAPVANNDNYSVDEDATLTVGAPGVLANDTDSDGDSLTALRLTNPTHGTLTFNANGSFTYRPATNYSGPDSFTYKASDGPRSSGAATVNITVRPVNDAPIARDDSYTATQNVTRTVAAPGVLANDTDAEGTGLRAFLATSPARGTVTLNTNGSFVYVPQTNYVGSDTFTYRARDASATSAVATVTINIVPAPIVVITPPANQTKCPGETATFSVTATGTALSYQWRKGTNVLAGRTNSTLVFSNVAAGDAGTYSVRMTNALGAVTNSATLTVNTPVSATPLTNLVRAIGANAVFRTVASGTGPITYVWRRNGTVIAGQTSSTLTLVNLNTNASGIYSVVVSGACGSVTNSATLFVDECFPAVDVVLVIDRSGSMTGKPYADAKTAVSNFVNNLKFGTNADLAALVSYNTNATLNQRLTNNVQAMRQSVASLPGAGGNTSISSGLQTGQAELASARHNSEALPVLVLLSDGLPTGGDTGSNALYHATQAKNAGTRVFTVGLGDVDHALMRGIASSTNDYFYTTNSSQLTALFNAISTVICRPPTNIVASGPTNLTLCAGATATFSVSAIGCMTFRYQWSKDGVALAGQTNSTIVVPNVSSNSAGVYSVAVLSDCQNKTNSATLTVNQPVFVVTPPVNQTAFVGGNVVFSVNATGAGLSYQWFSNGALVSTSNTLSLSNLATNDAGSYCVRVSGTCGGPVTNCAVLTIQNRAPVANDDNYSTVEDTPLTIPAPGVLGNDTDADGDTLVAIIANAPLFGAVTLNSDGSFLYRPATNYTGQDTFTYRANDGRLTSAVATVTINVTPRNDAPVARDDSYTTPADTLLTVNAPGVLANDTDIEGSPLSSLLVTNPVHGTLTLSANGSFTYLPNTNFSGSDVFTYRATDGNATSGVATVTITVVPTNVVVIMPPVNQTNCPGETAVFNVTATGTALTYQWLFGTNVLNGATNRTLVLPNVAATNAGTYCVIVNGAAGSPVTNCAMLVINENTIIARPLVDRVVCPNTSVLLPVHATGTALTYRWYHGAALLPNQTTSTLSLSNVTALNAGVYTVVISGACGAPVTNSATLTVNQTTAITTPPVNQMGLVGGNVTFSVGAIGTSLSYQWFFNGTLVGTNSTLTLNNVTTNQAGLYCVVVSGVCGSPLTNCATLNFHNRAPVASNDTYSVVEDNALNISVPGVLGNDSDADGDTLTAALASAPLHGTVTMNANGSFVYQPSTNYTGPDSFTYRANDSKTNSNVATVFISVTPFNDAPVANDDAYTINEDTVLNISAPGVLGNDTDGDGDVLRALLVGNPAHGTLALATNGAFIYTPSTNYHGTDSFTYRASDGALDSSVATVTITINPTNDTPLAVNDDAYTTPEDTTLTVLPRGVLTNDIDADGDLLMALLVSGTTNGTLTLVTNGGFVYVPNTNFNGLDRFTYQSTDGRATSQVATVTITVTPANDPPVANNDAYTMMAGTTRVVSAPGVLANDTDVEGDALTALLVGNPANGTVLLNANGSFSYTPVTNYSGVDTFTYRASDGNGMSSAATVTMTITPQPVIIVTPPPNRTNCPGNTVMFNVTATGTALAYQWSFAGNVLAGQTNSTLVLPNVSATNAGAYCVVVSGAAGAITNCAFLVVNTNVIVVQPPVDVVVCENITAQFRVEAIGTGLGYQWYRGSTLLVNQTNNILTLGNVSVSAAGAYTVVVSGLCGAPVTNSATLTVNQNAAVQTPPVPQSSFVGSNVTFTVGATGTGLTYQWFFNGAVVGTNSSLNLNNLSTNQAGAYCVVVRGMCGNPITNCTILTIVNRAPLANNDAYSVAEDMLLTISAPGVLGNDSDPDGDTLTSVLAIGPSHGTLVLNPNGSFTYRPATNFNGVDTFTYRANDTKLSSAPATVTITVTPVNDPPFAVNDDAYTTLEDQALTIAAPGVLMNDTDVDGDGLTVSLVSGPTNGTLVLNANGSFVYTPASNFFGSDSFIYVARDGAAQSAAATVRIQVLPVNDAPSFVAGPNQKVNQNAGAQTVANWATSISAGPANESGQTLTFNVLNDNNPLFSAQPAIAPNGTLTYTPAANVFGVANVRVTLRDNGGTANGGVDTSGEIVFRIVVNGPPTVSIVSPTNGTVFLGPATIGIVADAADPDGTVTNVQFLVNGAVLTNVTAAPFYFVWSNVLAGNYALRAIATDDCGLLATSAVVNVTVVTNAIVATGPIVLNRQNGLFEQFVTVSNRTTETWPNGVRLWVYNLDTTNRVWNPTGTNNGVPYLDRVVSVPPGGAVQFLVQYYVPNDRVVPTPTLIAVPLPYTSPVAVPEIVRIEPVASVMNKVHFTTQKDRYYVIQHTEDFVRWTSGPALVRGTGGIVVCPETCLGEKRFYRVLMMPR